MDNNSESNNVCDNIPRCMEIPHEAIVNRIELLDFPDGEYNLLLNKYWCCHSTCIDGRITFDITSALKNTKMGNYDLGTVIDIKPDIRKNEPIITNRDDFLNMYNIDSVALDTKQIKFMPHIATLHIKMYGYFFENNAWTTLTSRNYEHYSDVGDNYRLMLSPNFYTESIDFYVEGSGTIKLLIDDVLYDQLSIIDETTPYYRMVLSKECNGEKLKNALIIVIGCKIVKILQNYR